ncbi:MAG: nucleotidyltransferase family protein [Pseudobdellovibrionaceae bacterium]|nr:nucleotidyltransferase family protein [Bdellovibrionales bacterium]USN47585.1 MAG: nucleotidyltransferase family protein [Pseudobdellovibrionaceae bacterium]
MTDRDQVASLLASHKGELRNLKVESVHLFGSVARNEGKENSDLDVLVAFSEPVGMFQFLEVKYFLEGLFGCKVDLATEQALHPHLKEQILKEAIRVA